MADNFERYLDEELRRSGDTDRIEVAIRVIFVHYRARLSSYASHLLRDRPEWSDDVLMDTIVRVYEQKDRLLDQPSPVRWVFRMMYFVMKEKRNAEVSPVKVDYEAAGVVIYSDDRSDEKLRSREVMLAIDEAMESLTTNEREVFKRYYFESQDRMRIAFELGLAPQTVSNLLTLARKKVWAYLEGLTS